MSSLFLRPFSKTSLFKRLISFLSLSASEQNIPVQFKLLTCYPYSLSAFYSSSKASLLSTSARQTVPVRLTRFGKRGTTRPLILATLFCSLIILAKGVRFLHPSRKKPLAIHPRFLTIWQSLLLASPIRQFFFFFFFFLRGCMNNKCKDFYCIAILIYQSKIFRLLSPSESSLINNAQHFIAGH